MNRRRLLGRAYGGSNVRKWIFLMPDPSRAGAIVAP
jgi:hypothetical protein